MSPQINRPSDLSPVPRPNQQPRAPQRVVRRLLPRHFLPLPCFLLMLCASVTPSLAQVPFVCSGEVLIVQDANALLHQIDQSASKWTFLSVGGRAGVEYNSLGFRSTDRMLYAIQLIPGGNSQLVRIDSTGTVFGLGQPSGLPNDLRFDAGDITPDGETMYVTIGALTNGLLYAIDLTTAGFPQRFGYPIQITGDTGAVHDWAVDPISGLLFGGDKTDGEVAILDPLTGIRTDNPATGGGGALALPIGASYGAAWFDASGNPLSPLNLFLYRNDGEILEIAVEGQLFLEDIRPGPGSSRNDGAICRQGVIGAAKRMVASSRTLPATVTIDYFFENLQQSETLSDVSAADDLEAVFGAHGADWTFTSISSNPAVAANPAFDGHANLELVAAGYDLAPGSALAVTVTLDLLTFGSLPASGSFCNQVQVTGEIAGGMVYGDLSTEGFDADPSGDGYPAEREPSCLEMAPPLACAPYVIQNVNSQLLRVDTSPLSFVPIGQPTGREINAIGYRSADGLIYGLELKPSGNVQIVRIDGNGKVHDLGRPEGLPSNVRFDAGDVFGDTMYITGHGQPLYKLSLAEVPILPAVTVVEVTAHDGIVNDWAFDRISGWLVGGDQTDGEIALLNPVDGQRIDNPSSGSSSFALPLPTGSAYGAAWLSRTGEPFAPFELFLYRNSGEALEVGFNISLFVDDVHATPIVSRNDGAACLD